MCAGSQGGKDLAIDTVIPTPDGDRRIGDILVGDYVFDGNGNPTRVLYVSPVFDDHRCFEITFDNGDKVIAGENHLWKVRDTKRRKNDDRRVVVNTRQDIKSCVPSVTGEIVVETVDMYNNYNSGKYNLYSIDISGRAEYEEKKLEVHPYTLGVWLGDGNSNDFVITNPLRDYSIVQRIKDYGDIVVELSHKDRCHKYKVGSEYRKDNPKNSFLKAMNLHFNKHIPYVYKYSSVEQRLELVRGMMDTDGYIDTRGHMEYTSIRMRLAEDFREVLSSLGVKSKLHTKTKKIKDEDYTFYCVSFNGDKYDYFYLKRKLDRQKSCAKENTRRLYIRDIREVPTVKTKCIMVDNSDHVFLCTKSYIRTHNTSFGGWWLWNEIQNKGRGDYLAVTATYDLFKLKMLPSLLLIFKNILGIGRYWVEDKIIEIADPKTGEFLAERSVDPMWARIILRSADSEGGLESTTASGAWLDECGQEKFKLGSFKAVRRRLALKQGRILMTTTLYQEGWLTEMFIDPVLKSNKSKFFRDGFGEIDYTEDEKLDVGLIQFDSTVNPTFSVEEFESQSELLSEEEIAMFLRGRKAGSSRYRIYDVFDPQEDVCEPFAIPSDWKRYWGIDFGGVHMACVYYAEEPKTRTLYCYREYMGGSKEIEQYAKDIKAGEIGIPRLCVGGAKSEDQWRKEFAKYGLPIAKPSVSDVELGIKRVYAVNKQHKIVYFKTCNGIINEKKIYQRERDSMGNPKNEIKDKNKFHWLDCERYIISQIRTGSNVGVKPQVLGGNDERNTED